MGIKNSVVIEGDPANFKRYRRIIYSLIFIGMCVGILITPFAGATAIIFVSTGISPYAWALWLFLSGIFIMWDTIRGAVINAIWLGAFWVYSLVAIIGVIMGIGPLSSGTLVVIYGGLSLILFVEFIEDARWTASRRS